jgi:hypothetical protein
MNDVREAISLLEVIVTNRLNYLCHRIKQPVEIVSTNRREVDYTSDQHQNHESKECLHRPKCPPSSRPLV